MAERRSAHPPNGAATPAVRRRPARSANGQAPAAKGTAPAKGGATVNDAATGKRRAGSNGRAGTVPATNGHAAAEARREPSPNGARPPAGPVIPAPVAVSPDPAPESPDGAVDVWDERVAGALAFLRRRLTGEYEVDEFGFDPELAGVTVHPVLRLLYERYFRVEVTGVEQLPVDGSALLVANHSGTLPVDALMLTMAVHDETPTRRHLRLLGADLVFRVPVLSELARKFGTTLACNPDAERLLRNGEYVGVFPEGFKGIGKPYRERYKLQRFGRGGFVSAALRTGTPIVPVSIVGAEEIYPILANIKPLARVTGLPYVPVTPLFPWFGALGALPLPSKWLIEFGSPIDTTEFGGDADDPIVVFNLADQVRETIQETLHTLLERRPDPFG
jgi:1-acyl-sn-glycerol-3-phosphate acyltransferase